MKTLLFFLLIPFVISLRGEDNLLESQNHLYVPFVPEGYPTIKISNPSDQALVINSIKADCSCFKVSKYPDLLSPNSFDWVELKATSATRVWKNLQLVVDRSNRTPLTLSFWVMAFDPKLVTLVTPFFSPNDISSKILNIVVVGRSELVNKLWINSDEHFWLTDDIITPLNTRNKIYVTRKLTIAFDELTFKQMKESLGYAIPSVNSDSQRLDIAFIK